jgi:putative exosortase-associated protein (TIGR04073 family)
MKFFMIIGIGCFLVSGNGYAGPFVKLGRGLTNIVTAPAEIIYEPLKLKENNNAWVSWLGGVPKGLVYYPFRAVVGVYETLTFLIPYPKEYAPLIKPETLVEGFESL